MVFGQAVEQPLKGLLRAPGSLPLMLYLPKGWHSNQVKRGRGFE